MKKIIIIGCPGSGKSTFSKSLNRITKIPLYHLDNIFWKSDKTTVEKTVFLDMLRKIMQKDKWIIDGNYNSTMELRMKMCDTVVFLDYPLDICLKGIEERKGRARSDLPWIEPKEDDEEFINFVKNYNLQSRPKVLELLDKYSHKDIFVFSNRTQAEKFLSEIK